MDIVHRDGMFVSFDTAKIVTAVSKAFLRSREKKLGKQHSVYEEVLYRLLTEECGGPAREECIREIVKEIRIMLEDARRELRLIRIEKRRLDKEDCCRIKHLLLDQLRSLDRSKSMRFATDMSLVTIPTPPTVDTVSGSLRCGRVDYVGVPPVISTFVRTEPLGFPRILRQHLFAQFAPPDIFMFLPMYKHLQCRDLDAQHR